MIGRVISHYLIKEQLGEGGMGVVYRAEDTLLGRHVAVKFLTAAGGGQQFRARFLREARAASSLNHPNIATVHEYGETPEGDPFIVMELVEGRTLDEMLRSDAPPKLLHALDVVERVAEALAEAHARGVIHRDIKPANVAVRARNGDGSAPAVVKVLDFGLAKLAPAAWPNGATLQAEAPTMLGNLTAEHVVLGTPLYISPEQARGEEVDARSDLFSLGAMLYECVAGRPPFHGATVGEIFYQVGKIDPPPPSSLNPRATPELDRVVMKALAKRPEDRHHSADELLADLRAARASLAPDSTAPRTAYVTREAATSRVSRALSTLNLLRRPRYYVPAFAALALAVGASLWATRAGRVPPPHPKAVERFEQGTRALADGTYYKASKLLSDAVEIDPRFALAHARLAEAWMELDYPQRAMSSMMTAQALTRDGGGPQRAEDLPYLDAIDATIRRDHRRAVKVYSEIAERTPDRSHVHVDLGRAHEHNEEPNKALASYLRATELDSREAAAFLRAGVLYGRTRETLAAESSFAHAEKIYKSIDNLEGLTETYYQRGALLATTGRPADARALIESARDLAANSGNDYQQIKALLALSSISAAGGRTADAKQEAGRALELARLSGVEGLTAQGLVDLGVAFLVRAEHREAEEYFRQALAFAQASQSRRAEAQASLGMARLYVQTERNTDEALRHIERALGFFEAGGYGREVAQARLLHDRAKLRRGDLDGSREVYARLLGLAEQSGDPSLLAAAHQSAGRWLAEREESYSEALRHYDDYETISRRLGNPLNVGYALLYRADMLWRIGRYDDSRRVRDSLPSVAEQLDSKYRATLLARHQLQSAQAALSRRNFAEAATAAARAVAMADSDDITRAAIEARSALCLAQSLAGRRGQELCAEALERASRGSDPRLLSNARSALAEVRLAAGDAAGALGEVRHAQEHFARAGQIESEWRAHLVAGLALRRLGDGQAARVHLARAEELLARMRGRWESGAFDGYLSRPDVQFYRRQLGEALAAL